MVLPLTEDEIKVVTNSEFLVTKNNIIQKVQQAFAGFTEEYKSILKQSLFNTEELLHAKISKGENYKGLPYVILDYPRQFGKIDAFAIRTFFWWGNFFSITLQLSGKYHQQYTEPIEKAINKNLLKEWYISCSSNPWEHHFDNSNYKLIGQGESHTVSKLPYIKFAKKIPLEKWDEAEFFFKENYKFLITVLSS